MKRLTKKPLLSNHLDLQLSNLSKIILTAESEWAQQFWYYTKQRLIQKYSAVYPEVCKKYSKDATII